MIDRISKNEERLDRLIESVNELRGSLDKFESCQKDLILLNKYYGSKNWYKDKECFENGKLSNVKAGVLSEDAIWNLLEDINELKQDMKRISNKKL